MTLRAVARRYDVLHAHFGPVANSFRFARSLWRAPMVATFHGYDFCVVPREEGPDVYRHLFGTADAITVNSEYTRARVIELVSDSLKTGQPAKGEWRVEWHHDWSSSQHTLIGWRRRG